MKRLREILNAEYETKVRHAFEELEELKLVLEEGAKEKQAKNERTLQRKIELKDGEIDELNQLVSKLQAKLKEQKGKSELAEKDMENYTATIQKGENTRQELEKEVERM